MSGSTPHLPRLLHVLRQDERHGLSALLRAVATAAGGSGAMLWNGGTGAPSIAALWFAHPPAAPVPATPDPVTAAAFETGSLALPGDGAAGVIAALPVAGGEDGPAVLTLYGTGELAGDSFDAIVDLLDVLPDLCRIVRERRGLALVRRCNDILHEADVAAAKRPLDPERVSHFLSQVCAAVAEAIPCAEVAVYLREPDAPDHAYPLVASATGAAPGSMVVLRGVGPVGAAVEEGRPEVAAEVALMAAPIISGDAVWGAIACTGSAGPRPHFDRFDLAALAPVTPQLARYWNTWLQRRTISEENESWRQLAAGLTAFDVLLSEQLAGAAEPDDDRVYEAAVDMVRRVVPHCGGGEVWQPAERGGRLVRRSAPQCGRRDAPTPRMVRAYRSDDQSIMTDPDEIAAEGARAGTGWLVYTPLRVGRRRYGLFAASGDSAALQHSAPQVCRIIGGQLGLYLHLRQTQAELDSTVKGQADAMEDLKHQLVGPLLYATNRTESLLDGRNPDGRSPSGGRLFDGRAEVRLQAIRGACRKASRVALSAGVFAALSRNQRPRPKLEFLSADDLLRLLIAGADDAQLLGNPEFPIEFTVDRDAVRALGRRLIKTDRTFLEQCVGNLLDNAAKYSYPNTRVDIGGRIDGDSFAITVTNVGLVVDAAETELCLRRNWRGDAARFVTGEGSGIGLWIVDNLMRCMEGRVSLASTAGRTTVSLTFPLRLTSGSRP